MKSYGKFEAVREVFQTPVSAIWTARAVGTQGAAGLSIKLIQPESVVFAGKGAAAAEELLVSAALQQSIANKSEHWAPVYELGYDGTTAFYVGRLYDRSCQRMIDAKTKLNSTDLLIITSAIVEGLNDLRTAFDRSHGNLKPANVLIAGRGRIRREDIRLTDPHAGDEELPSMTRSPDVKAIGEIIFALVTGRSHTSARWPVPQSVEWNRLGSSGSQWLELCNDLLNMMARQGPMSLGKIQARLSAMRLGRRRMSRKWIAVAAVVGIAACGYVYRDHMRGWTDKGKQWTARLGHQRNTVSGANRLPGTQPFASSQPILAPVVAVRPPPVPKPSVPSPLEQKPTDTTPVVVAVIPPPVKPAPVKVVQPPPVQPAPVGIAPVEIAPPQPAINPSLAAEVITPQPTPPRVIPAPTPLPVIQLPTFLTGTAAAKFLDAISQLSTSAKADQRTKFVQSVGSLEAQYPPAVIHGDRPWQKELSKLIELKREAELTAAVAALAESATVDPSKYKAFVASAQSFNAEASDAEDAMNIGASWSPESNSLNIQKTRSDEDRLFGDPKLRATAAPAVLEEMRAVDDAVASQNARGLLDILHNDSSSLPARVAAWQALDLPKMRGHWPAGREEFVAGQRDGDSLIAAASGTSINTKSSITEYQDRRLKAFYASLTTEPIVTDAVTHLAEAEGNRADQRPPWLEFDRILYSLAANPAIPSDEEMKKLRSLSGIPAAAELYSALAKAKNAAANDQPLTGTGPGLLNWTARPYKASGIQGCLYSTQNCPSIEFIRVEPGAGKGLPFYLSTTEVPVGLIAAVLGDPLQSSASATQAMKGLNPVKVSPMPGAHVWKFSTGKAIEIDSESYLQYFRQAPTPDLPMQQITPQAALYLARDLGCRLPTSAEWTAAFAMATNPPDPTDPIKGFATAGWKLRDADFTSLVDKAALNQRFPDDGIFLGPDASLIPAGAAATIWAPTAVQKLGGWTVADLKTDRQAQRQIARLDESSSDFRADLIDVAQVGFRPVGSTHHVFHDLIGNVAEFVLDSAASDVELLSPGTKISEKEINNFFSVKDHAGQLGVIGGSFLSPPELDPTTRIPLPAGATNMAFTDVGFRLAFTDPRAFADPSTVIKHTGYLYPPASVKSVDTAP